MLFLIVSKPLKNPENPFQTCKSTLQVCAYIYIYIHVCIYIYVCIRICMYVFMYVYMYAMYVCMYVRRVAGFSGALFGNKDWLYSTHSKFFRHMSGFIVHGGLPFICSIGRVRLFYRAQRKSRIAELKQCHMHFLSHLECMCITLCINIQRVALRMAGKLLCTS